MYQMKKFFKDGGEMKHFLVKQKFWEFNRPILQSSIYQILILHKVYLSQIYTRRHVKRISSGRRKIISYRNAHLHKWIRRDRTGK